MSQDALAPFTRKLERLGLAPDEQSLMIAGVSRVRRFDAGESIITAASPAAHALIMLKGLAVRLKSGLKGERQILSFCIPGDICAAQAAVADVSDDGLAAITASTLALIPRATLRNLLEQQPSLAMTLWRNTVAEAAVGREWVFNLGRRSAAERIAHLFCEMHVRLERAGLATPTQFGFPVTQADLADATGLSVVHVNRNLQTLRATGLIAFLKGQVTVLDRERLQDLAGFVGDYLDLEPSRLSANGWTSRQAPHASLVESTASAP